MSFLILYLVITEGKNAVKKPKLTVCLEQSESSFDNESDISDTSSKDVEEKASGSSYRSKEIAKKSMCS